jgi:hypothetical protein
MYFLHLVVERGHGLWKCDLSWGHCPFPGWHRNEHGALVNNKCRKIRTGVGNWSTTNFTLTAVEMNSRLVWSEVRDKLPELWHGSTLTPEHFNRSLENCRTI